MKNFKLLLVALFTLSFTFYSIGQDRVNRQKLTFTESSQILKKATGWAYNTTIGEWIDYPNAIETNKEFKTTYKSLAGAYMNSQCDQNFYSVQTRTITFKDNKYYVLVVGRLNGNFEYPTIGRDWYYFTITCGFIFTESEYNKLLNINANETIVIETQFQTTQGGRYTNYDETLFLDNIQTELNTTKSKYSSVYKFAIKKTDKSEYRFLLPAQYFNNPPDLEKSYFETTDIEFSKILIK